MSASGRSAAGILLLALSPLWLLGIVVVLIGLVDLKVSHANLCHALEKDGVGARAVVHQVGATDRHAWLLRFPAMGGEEHHAFLRREHVPPARRANLHEGVRLKIRYLPYGDMALVVEEDLAWLREHGGPDLSVHLALLLAFAFLLSLRPEILYLGLGIDSAPDTAKSTAPPDPGR